LVRNSSITKSWQQMHSFLFFLFKKIVVIAPQALSIYSFVNPVVCGQAVGYWVEPVCSPKQLAADGLYTGYAHDREAKSTGCPHGVRLANLHVFTHRYC
jgi:hypothetical protein